MKKLKIDGQSLTLEQIEFFINENPTVSLTQDAKKKVNIANEIMGEDLKDWI